MVPSLEEGKNKVADKHKAADKLLEGMLTIKVRPSVIRVPDERNFAFLEPIAKGIGPKLEKTAGMEELDQVLEDLMGTF